MNLDELRASLSEIASSAQDAFVNDDTVLRREIFNEVEKRKRGGIDEDQMAMHHKMFGQHKLGTTIRDIFEWSDPDHREARAAQGLGVGDTWQQKVGTTAGRAAADIASDNSRNIYWFLNAIQAGTNVIVDAALTKSDPDLRGTSPVWDERSGDPLEVRDDTRDQAIKQGVVNKHGDRMPGYRTKTVGEGKKARRYYTQTNLGPSMSNVLQIPGALAINQSLGLLNPFGGHEGYQAVVPDEEDPTKTANIFSEVAQKYIMGRTGNLLPWEEFRKVRPDVSKEEYRRYKQFKYEKGLDLNPFDDGKMTAPFGVLKYTNDGIHGAELQYLGRSLPMTTGAIPLASAIGGLMVGNRLKDKLPDSAVRTQADVDKYRKQTRNRTLGGGLAGYAVGYVGGQLIENERRNRNMRENLPKTPGISNPEMSNL